MKLHIITDLYAELTGYGKCLRTKRMKEYKDEII